MIYTKTLCQRAVEHKRTYTKIIVVQCGFHISTKKLRVCRFKVQCSFIFCNIWTQIDYTEDLDDEYMEYGMDCIEE